GLFLGVKDVCCGVGGDGKGCGCNCLANKVCISCPIGDFSADLSSVWCWIGFLFNLESLRIIWVKSADFGLPMSGELVNVSRCT
ncbi:MAG TPA: hypothetical protein DEP38_05895, partial [Cyanobacteria bacterium UBA9226]|nr:hypothetical protein [Cyanobacteria bacterium UBA9226]